MAADTLDKPRHIKYWQRCFNTYLPSPYTANDSTRLMFAFFTASALDLFSVPFTAKDRSSIRSWVLSLQHPDGGFCGSPAHALTGQDAVKGSANLAATYFALLLLGLAAGTDAEAKAAFAGVERRKLLRWVKSLQRADGSFGQVVWDGEAVGGRDMRHSYVASAIRWMLRGDVEEGDDDWEEDIDIEGMIRHIQSTQTYDGGMAETSEQESHAGYAYCAIAALYMLDRPQSSIAFHKSSTVARGVNDQEGLLNFLSHRQFSYLAKEEEDVSDEEDANYIQSDLGDLSLADGCVHVGYNGRWNKKADTCYCWWVAGTLAMLDGFHAVNIPPSRKFILDITQHRIGGFSKVAGGPPDLYHSYLGLAALAVMGDKDLKDFDAGLCCSKDTLRKIQLAREGLLAEQKKGDLDFEKDGFWESVRKAK